MNASERLRRYLEQRQEMGENEFLLDSMSVDDVMKAIGAINAGSKGPVNAAGRDWRETLREEPREAEGLKAPADSAELFDDDIMRLTSLKSIDNAVAKCTRCRLYKTATHPVPGEGSPKAKLVCVGEAPGANEDATGRPFVGQAGQLLTKILAAVDLKREDVFICNVLKHRPPGNRNPLPDEVTACSPYLIRQLELIKPKVIVAFGTFAAQTLLDTKTPIGKLRGSVHQYHGIPLVVTYHPAALLRNPAWKRPTWEDVKLARRVLDSPATRA
ncbi:MAG: uracil-DNA glycosylase [Gemmatimonadaceae bacterium]